MGAQAQERESLEATSGPGTWGSGVAVALWASDRGWVQAGTDSTDA